MDELVQKIDQVSNDIGLNRYLSVNAREHIINDFTWDVTTEKLIDHFKTILASSL
jgi:glycosyltransferase involved in cell wall biosynthesis